MSRGFLLYLCLLAVVCYAIVFLPEKVLADNEIDLTQSGNNVTLTIDQIGGQNFVGGISGQSFSGSLSGSDNEIIIHQWVPLPGTNDNVIYIYDFDGNNNYVELRQGSDRRDGKGTNVYIDNTEYSGHEMLFDLDGSNNEIIIGQRNTSDQGHYAHIGIWSDNNTVTTTSGNTGYKELYVYTDVDGNTIDVFQSGTQAADAYLDISGAYGTNISVIQDNDSSAVSYTLFQNCQTAGGCSITVTQEN